MPWIAGIVGRGVVGQAVEGLPGGDKAEQQHQQQAAGNSLLAGLPPPLGEIMNMLNPLK